MDTAAYHQRRGELATYFDLTASQTWAKLTSDAPVGRIRATVREGRDHMRETLLGWLPADLTGRRVLDAGCGTGMLAVEAARRGAEVVAIDLSPTLIELARERQPHHPGAGSVEFRVGDMLAPGEERFDHVVAMDSIIHYRPPEMVAMLAALADRAKDSLVVTFAPKTPLLATMHLSGKLFPRGSKSPAIEPIREAKLRRLIAKEPGLVGWSAERTHRINRGFYISQALEIRAR
jgi:magnesium-protoporphyrin O-methyltransferase